MKTSINKSLGQSILWVGSYFCVMFLYTAINMGVCAHCGYNAVSYFTTIAPLIGK